MFWFGNLNVDASLAQEDLMLNGEPLVEALERQYIDFPEHLCLHFKQRANVANPFKHLLAAINDDQSLAIRGCEETF